MRSRVFCSVLVAPFLAWAWLLVLPEPGFCRAGGGHSYSSSRSSSSSSRSSSRSSSSGSRSSRSSGSHGGSGRPMNGFDMIILIGFLAFLAYAKSVERQSGFGNNGEINLGAVFTPPRSLRRQDPARMAAAEQALKVRDPKWDPRRFLGRVKKGFTLIQNGWSNQDLSNVQAFLTDGVFERFTLQIREMRDDGIRDHMENLKILDARLMQIESDPQFDTIHVAIRASAINYRVSLRNNRRLDGPLGTEEFEEVWSFLRRPGARTLEKPGLIEGACPSCGAPVEIARAATCAYCKVFLRSGEYDWVLAEITQACEWSPQETSTNPGVVALRELDPGFGIQQIEDRASVIFWRYVSAFRQGKAEPLLKHVHPSLLEKIRHQLTPDPDGSRTVYLHAAVGSVTVQSAFPGTPGMPGAEGTEGAFDRVFVELRWSWKTGRISSAGKIGNVAGNAVNSRKIYVLSRRSGVKTNLSLVLSSSCCNNCGAPESSSPSAVCEYCQTVLNDGSRDWVLQEITNAIPVNVQTAGGSPSQQGMTTSAGFRGSADGLRWLAQFMFLDGKIERAELEMLKQYARTHGISQNAFNDIFYAAKAGQAIPQVALNPAEIAETFRGLVRLALVDGSISNDEMQMLYEFGRRTKMSSEEMARIMEGEKKPAGGGHDLTL